MSRISKVDQTEALRQLQALKPGDTILTNLRSVSRSGMSRRMTVHIVEDGQLRNITWSVATLLGEKTKDGELRVGGCGMDMGFHVAYSLGRVLFPNGFGELGKGPHGHEVRPTTPDAAAKACAKGYAFRGRNGDTSGWDNDGGYALSHRWV